MLKEREEEKDCLNLGCGGVFFPDWTNCDFIPRPGIMGHDLRKPLPFVDEKFSATYSSHVLEHFNPSSGKSFLKEQFRVLKPEGICRVVVPDLETICKLYLKELKATEEGDDDAQQRHRWMTIELLDQMTRETSGGEMRRILNGDHFDFDQVAGRIGDEVLQNQNPSVTLTGSRSDIPKNRRKKKESVPQRLHRKYLKLKLKLQGNDQDPRITGEVHRWMYDRVSLRFLLEKTGFVKCRVCTFDDSGIPQWSKRNLDVSLYGDYPRKPDSLYMEGLKPA